MSHSELCRVARVYSRLGQAIASSMELGLGKSRLLGIGLEYADFREYQEGDDIRYVDWALSARSIDHNTGDYKLYTKVFHVEQMKNILFVVDLTDSMLIKEKIAATLYISSLLLELSHRLVDKVTLVTLSNGANVFRGLRGRDAIRIIFNTICGKGDIGGKERLDSLVDIFKAVSKKINAIAIVTDYAHELEEFNAIAKSRKTFAIPITVYVTLDKWEIEKPTDKAFITLIDIETHTSILEDLDEIYKAIRTHVNHVKTVLSSARINFLEVRGIIDAKIKTVKIVEAYIKMRQLQAIEK